jgi:competence protein ComEC
VLLLRDCEYGIVILIYLSAAWMVGIYLSSRLNAVPVALFGLLSLLPLSIAWLWRRKARRRLAALVALFGLLGALRYTLALPRFDERSVSNYNDRSRVVLTGVVIAEPDVRDTYTNLRLRAETLAHEEPDLNADSGPTSKGRRPVEVEGLVLVRAPRYPEHRYGDRLQVRGELQTPPVFEAFSYKDYLARRGIHSTVGWAQITTLERNQANPLYALLLRLKGRAHAVIADVVPEPGASLLSGILLGVEGGIPADLLDDFHATSTSHIIVISGFNMAIVGGVFSSLSIRLVGRRYAAWFATAAIALYTLLVGGAAAVVRAAVMSVVAVWGRHLGRQNSAPNALFGTALAMTAWNPHMLWDLGFLLSFMATLGLIWFAEPFQRGVAGLLTNVLPLRWVEPTANFVREPFVLSTASQLTTMPIILYVSHTLSIVTLLSNALILPLQTQVMLWGTAATVGGLLWRPLGRVLGWVAWLPLMGTIGAVEWTARLRHATLELRAVRPALLVGWYVVVSAAAWLLGQSAERRNEVWRALWQGLSRWFSNRLALKLLMGGLAVVALLVWLAVAALPDGRLHVTFLDVGEGDATFVETPAGQQILINGGASPSRLLGQLGRRIPFYDRTLDLIVLSDDRREHLDGLLPVLERYRVGQALYTPHACIRSACERWAALLQEQDVAVVSPVAGTRVDLGRGTVLTVLHPVSNSSGEEDSVTVRLDYGKTCFLVSDGAGYAAQEAMLARDENVRCDVLQMRSRRGESAVNAAFLSAVRPALVVLTGEGGEQGENESEPEWERWTRFGATVVRVSEYKSVEIVSDRVSYDVRGRP